MELTAGAQLNAGRTSSFIGSSALTSSLNTAKRGAHISLSGKHDFCFSGSGLRIHSSKSTLKEAFFSSLLSYEWDAGDRGQVFSFIRTLKMIGENSFSLLKSGK